jgi:hypothetical protein
MEAAADMIDPKFNKLPADAQGDVEQGSAVAVSDEEQQERLRRARSGLSINDTVAAGANMSVGSRGVDTSGTKAGAGAGAGTTFVTPGNPGESPAPNIVPGARTSGTTPQADNVSDQTPTIRLDEASEYRPTTDEISERAFRCWHERGCPHGSPEIDWQRAEQELREERRRSHNYSSASA